MWERVYSACVGKRLQCRGVSRITEGGGGGGGVPTLYFNRYISWEGGGIAVRLWLYTKSGGGGGCKGGGISFAMGEAAAAPPPPRPGLTGNRGEPLQYEPCDSPNMSEKGVSSLT